jgi:hypothetical protein
MTVATDPRKTGLTAGATLVAASAVALSVSNTTSEEALVTVSLPPPGVNGGYEVRTVWTVTNGANAKTPRIRLGGIGGTVYLGSAKTTIASYSDSRRIRNRGVTNSQVGSGSASVSFGDSGSAIVTSSVDWSVASDLVLSGQKAVGTDVLTLESYEIWHLPG